MKLLGDDAGHLETPANSMNPCLVPTSLGTQGRIFRSHDVARVFRAEVPTRWWGVLSVAQFFLRGRPERFEMAHQPITPTVREISQRELPNGHHFLGGAESVDLY